MKFPGAGNQIQNSVWNIPCLGARQQSPVPSQIVLMASESALIADIEQLILRVDRNALRLGQPGLFAFQDTEWGVLSLRHLGPDHHRSRMLDGDEKLFGIFVHRDAESTMRGLQLAGRSHISLLL